VAKAARPRPQRRPPTSPDAHGAVKGPAPDFVVVGLGNPGDEYDGTRHNVGFAVADAIAQRHHASWRTTRNRAFECDATTPSGRIALVKPQTYMNVSGEAVRGVLKAADLGPDRLCVVHDELDLPLGTLRLKVGGGTAGHNGLKSIVQCCRAKDFVRLRFGIGRPPGRMPAADFVLRRFRRDELDAVADAVARAVDVVESWTAHGVEATQNAFHVS
jgi:PTH1 family peptidyl-tRNA hydrolase